MWPKIEQRFVLGIELGFFFKKRVIGLPISLLLANHSSH